MPTSTFWAMQKQLPVTDDVHLRLLEEAVVRNYT
jgi:hypothetical protein